MSPFVITAARTGALPIQLRLYARDPGHALESAAELLPGHLLSVPSPEPEWQDEYS